MSKYLIHKLKISVGQLLTQILYYFYRRQKGSVSRLYPVLSTPQPPDNVSYRTFHHVVPLPICQPQFYATGLVEEDYVQKITTYGDNCTCVTGIISASNVDVSLPIGMHLWKHKIFEDGILGLEVLTNPKYVLDLESIPFREERQFSESILLSLPWHHNFFHWLIEILPRLQLYDLADDLHDLPLVVPKSSPTFIKDSLTLTGYIDKVLFIDDAVYKF